jgi:hypothetical protein
VSRQVPGLSLWLVCASLPAFAAGPATPTAAPPFPVSITFTEQPVKLARDTGMYSAGRGVALQADDLMTSGASTMLLDAGGTTIAVGPDSSVFIKNGEVVLLKGWLKVNGSATRALLLSTASMQFDSAGVAATLHATPGSSELFAESAAVTVQELPAAKPPHSVKVAREQFAVRQAAQPLKLAARPPAAFLAGMPRTFLDPLVPIHAKGAAVPPRRDRTATFAELAPLLAEQPSLRQQLQARFAPPRPARTAQQQQRSPNILF